MDYANPPRRMMILIALLEIDDWSSMVGTLLGK